MYDNITIEKVDIASSERKVLEEFLGRFDLLLDSDVEYTVAAKKDNEIVGTCSFAGKVLKCFAVSEDMQGEGIASKLMTHLTNALFDRGIYETFIFTKPRNKAIFIGLGYEEVHSTNDVCLLEGGTANVKRYVEDMFKRAGLSKGEKAGLVMNCNPFTLGHKYLIEKASRENEEVVVFIVEEERSLFPFKTRLQLVRKGTEEFKNVHVVPGGHYIISSNTFPSYFLRKEDRKLEAYTKLDAGIFGKYIAPAFNIVKRYVGTEPYCPMTSRYNASLMEVLPQYGVEVKLVLRLQIEERAVSASDVRNLIKAQELERMKKILPETTYEFLLSEEAREIIEKIKRSTSVH